MKGCYFPHEPAGKKWRLFSQSSESAPLLPESASVWLRRASRHHEDGVRDGYFCREASREAGCGARHSTRSKPRSAKSRFSRHDQRKNIPGFRRHRGPWRASPPGPTSSWTWVFSSQAFASLCCESTLSHDVVSCKIGRFTERDANFFRDPPKISAGIRHNPR